MQKDAEAELLRRSHCDRKGQEHRCVGVMTIDRMGVELNCELCGHDTQSLEGIGVLFEDAQAVLKAAGVDYQSLTQDQKRNVLREILAVKSGY